MNQVTTYPPTPSTTTTTTPPTLAPTGINNPHGYFAWGILALCIIGLLAIAASSWIGRRFGKRDMA